MNKDFIMLNNGEFFSIDDEKGYEFYNCNNRKDLEEYLEKKNEISSLDDEMNSIDLSIERLNEDKLNEVFEYNCNVIKNNFKRLLVAKILFFLFSTLLILGTLFSGSSLVGIISSCCVKIFELVTFGSWLGIVKEYKDIENKINSEKEVYHGNLEEKEKLEYEYDYLMHKRNELIRELDANFKLENDRENRKINYSFNNDSSLNRKIINTKKLVRVKNKDKE